MIVEDMPANPTATAEPVAAAEATATAGTKPVAGTKRPQLPRELQGKSFIGAALFIGFSTALFMIPAGIAFWLATWSPWPVWARVVAWLPCCVLAAQGLHLIGWVGHEGFHFNLAENKKVSAVVGLLFSSMIMSFMQIGAIALPHIVAVLYTGLRSYVEHAGTQTGEFRDSRTRTARFFSCWYYLNNYHLEHHLYPSVPCYRLPRVHTWLRTNGYLDGPEVPIEPTVAGAYAFTLGRYQYPEAPA